MVHKAQGGPGEGLCTNRMLDILVHGCPRIFRRNSYKEGKRALVERTRIADDFRRFPSRDPELPLELPPKGLPRPGGFQPLPSGAPAAGTAGADVLEEVIGGSVPAASAASCNKYLTSSVD